MFKIQYYSRLSNEDNQLNGIDVYEESFVFYIANFIAGKSDGAGYNFGLDS